MAATSDGKPRPNRKPDDTPTAQTVAAGQLRALIERIENLESDKKEIADDIKEVYAEAKSVGFDTKAMRVIIRARKKDPAKRREEAQMVDLYATALGIEDVFA